jgi:pyrimidine-nucleoside phosphorylase
MAGVCPTFESALNEVEAQLKSGAALECFRQMITAQGGDAGIIDNPSLLPAAPHVVDILFEESSPVWVEHVDSMDIAKVAYEAGLIGSSDSDEIHPAAGISSLAVVGDRVEPGDIIARLHHVDEGREAYWVECIQKAVTFSNEEVTLRSRIHKKISSK